MISMICFMKRSSYRISVFPVISSGFWQSHEIKQRRRDVARRRPAAVSRRAAEDKLAPGLVLWRRVRRYRVTWQVHLFGVAVVRGHDGDAAALRPWRKAPGPRLRPTASAAFTAAS